MTYFFLFYCLLTNQFNNPFPSSFFTAFCIVR